MYSPPVDHDPVGIFQQSQVKEKTTTRLKDVQQYQLVARRAMRREWRGLKYPGSSGKVHNGNDEIHSRAFHFSTFIPCRKLEQSAKSCL